MNNTVSEFAEETPFPVPASPTNELPSPTATVGLPSTPEPTPTVPIIVVGEGSEEIGGIAGSIFVIDVLWNEMEIKRADDALFHVNVSVGLGWGDEEVNAYRQEVYENAKGSSLKIEELDALVREYSNSIIAKEMERVKSIGMILLEEKPTSIDVLMTKEQFAQLVPADRYCYVVRWAKSDIDEGEGYAAVTPTPTPVPANVISIDECCGKVRKELVGEYDADQFTAVFVYFGDHFEEGFRLLHEQYPEEYAAYLWLKDYEEPTDADDPRVKLALSAYEHHIELGKRWRDEEIEAFFKRNPDWRYYQVDYDMGLCLQIPYRMIPEIAQDVRVQELVWKRYPSVQYVELIGEYNGRSVYDLRYHQNEE